MKLLKPLGCLFSNGGGNEKEPTTLVEGQGIGFRTGVRLKSRQVFEKAEMQYLQGFADFKHIVWDCLEPKKSIKNHQNWCQIGVKKRLLKGNE